MIGFNYITTVSGHDQTTGKPCDWHIWERPSKSWHHQNDEVEMRYVLSRVYPKRSIQDHQPRSTSGTWGRDGLIEMMDRAGIVHNDFN